jgi:ADP-dependent NAD(P)H-hydrate dehydratase / NAD(P)H-hydrate epimerase
MKIVTAAEMREIDRLTTEQYGIPSLTLMENAGTAVAEFAQKHFDFQAVCVVCGKGNNGGDGFVAARKLHEAGKKVAVIVLAKSGDDLRFDAAAMFQKLPITPLWVSEEEQFMQAEVQEALKAELIVDAILGTGFKPPIQGIGRKAVEAINGCSGQVLAVDLPSGAYSDSFLKASDQGSMARSDAIITFTAAKAVHAFGSTTDGPIAVSSIGSPDGLILEAEALNLEVYSPAYLNVVFSPRPVEAHKGDFGHVLVVGGSIGKAGAAAMAGIAALRSGAGLVTVASPRSVQPTIASFAPELMTEPLPETAEGTLSGEALERIESLATKKDAVVLGPGLSRHEETDKLIRTLVAKLKETKLVIDADGLNAFAGHTNQLRSDSLLILTPHPGELARLTGTAVDAIENDRLRIGRETARKLDAILVLKGHRTLTASPSGHLWVNVSGNPGMAKGGSGDVLSGIIAATLNQTQGGFWWRVSLKRAARMQELMRLREQGDAAASRDLEQINRYNTSDMFAFYVATGVCLHGIAGDIARDLYGEQSMLARDITDSIGEAIAAAKDLSRDDRFRYLQR